MRRASGFSLVELMLTVAIVGALAAIAIPSWGAMVSRSRQAEAKVALEAVWALETGYFAEHATYGSLSEVGFEVESGRYGYLISATSYQPPSDQVDVGGGGAGANAMPEDIPEFFRSAADDDDDDDGGDDGGGPPGFPEPPDPDSPPGESSGYATGNPHYGARSFEVVALGVISMANAPNDLDIWSIDNARSLENINPGY